MCLRMMNASFSICLDTYANEKLVRPSHAYMKQHKRTECWHLENDVLLYKKLTTPPKRNKLHLAMDSAKRCIASILYIPHHQVMELLLAQYDYPLGDMFNLGNFFSTHREHCYALATIRNTLDCH